MAEKGKENTVTGVDPAAMAASGGAPFVIPPLTKSSTGLQRRQDLAERDQKLDDKLQEIKISLQSSNDNIAKTPGKEGSINNNHAPKTPGATPGRSRPAPVAMPSPGLRRIRERLVGEGEQNSSSTFGGGGTKSTLSKEDLLAREQASRAMAEAEKSAAAAIDAIFAQQEGTLLAMSAALRAESSGSGGGGNCSNATSILLERIAKAVEETTREQLAALSGVSKEGDDILQTAVYWITLARFESNHGRDEAARKYLTDGITCMEAKNNEEQSAVTASNTTQMNALRLALDRVDKKLAKNEEGEQEEEQKAEAAKPKPRLPPSAKVNKSRSRSSAKAKEEAPVTPTRRSSRIEAKKSAEKEKK